MEMQKVRGLSATWLKYFACISMLVDHAAACFCPADSPWWLVLRGFGRLAFPIFAFFIAEGCRRSRSLSDYAKRLFLFALVAQLPFMMVFRKPGGSVILTFFLAVAAVVLYERGRDTLPRPVAALVALPMALMAYWMDTDYGWLGVLLIFALYLCGKNRSARYVCFTVGLFWFYGGLYMIFALCALPLLHCYNGHRGVGGKWFFYWFYPVHLLALYLIYVVRYVL